jgi:ADP-ribosyl-[dinitrogen reductase] hydrolase
MAVIRLGGDADTNAACYGQLAGAYYGYKKIPKEWRDGVYLADELIEVADELLRMPECPIIRTRFEDDEHFKRLS